MQHLTIKIKLKLRLFEVVEEIFFIDAFEFCDEIFKKEPKLGDEVGIFGVGDFMKEQEVF